MVRILFFLVGDQPAHTDYADDVQFAVTAARAARAGIVINTVLCANRGERGDPTAARQWRELERAGGVERVGGVERLEARLATHAVAERDRRRGGATQVDAPWTELRGDGCCRGAASWASRGDGASARIICRSLYCTAPLLRLGR